MQAGGIVVLVDGEIQGAIRNQGDVDDGFACSGVRRVRKNRQSRFCRKAITNSPEVLVRPFPKTGRQIRGEGIAGVVILDTDVFLAGNVYEPMVRQILPAGNPIAKILAVSLIDCCIRPNQGAHAIPCIVGRKGEFVEPAQKNGRGVLVIVTQRLPVTIFQIYVDRIKAMLQVSEGVIALGVGSGFKPLRDD